MSSLHTVIEFNITETAAGMYSMRRQEDQQNALSRRMEITGRIRLPFLWSASVNNPHWEIQFHVYAW